MQLCVSVLQHPDIFWRYPSFFLLENCLLPLILLLLLFSPMATNPFLVLLPEMWKTIREYLTMPFDVRDRVRLQRTCKKAYRLDRGTLFAPLWTPPDEINRNPSIFYEYSARAYFFMHTLYQNGICDNPCFLAPDRLETETYSYSHETKELLCGLTLIWHLGPGIIMSLRYYKEGVHGDNQPPWCFEFSVSEPREASSEYNQSSVTLEVEGKTFSDLLEQVPMLGFGISIDRMHHRAMANDLSGLLLSEAARKAYED
jgi:hypothetical protein